MDPNPNLGRIAEDWIEQICVSSFLADFTVRSPTYRKGGRQTKEAADLLVVFGETLLIIQVKTKQVTDAAAILSQVDLARAANSVGRALEQFRAMVEALNDPVFFTFTNARGHALQMEKAAIKNVVALVVYGLLAPDGEFSRTKLRFIPSCLSEESIPIHLFSMEEFGVLTLLADTLPDFLTFLDVRGYLHAKNLIRREARPVDVWALATFEPARLREAMKTGTVLEIDGLQDQYLETMRGWEAAEKPSYFVDWLIKKLYEGIDSPVEANAELIAKTRQLAPPGSLEAFQKTIPKLAMLRRRDRTELAVRFAEKIERAQADGLAFCVLKFANHNEAFIVIAVDAPRTERQVILVNLARAAAYKVGVSHVIGIATAPVTLGSADCDVVIVDTKDMTIDERLIAAVKYYFGEVQEVCRPPTTPAVG